MTLPKYKNLETKFCLIEGNSINYILRVFLYLLNPVSPITLQLNKNK